jgi:hypothetical protein
MNLSTLISEMMAIVEKDVISDFHFIRSSLEQVFINFAKY